MTHSNNEAQNTHDALELAVEYIRAAGFSIVDLRENKVGPKSLYEQVIQRLSYTDVYEPMHLKVSEIRERLAPHPNQTFIHKEDNEATSIYMANLNMAVISLTDGRCINLAGDDTVFSIMTHVMSVCHDTDKIIGATLVAVKALRALVAIESVPIELPNEYFVYGAVWLRDNILAGIRDESLIANLSLTGKDLLDRLYANNTMVENIVIGDEVVKISKITGGGPNRALISYDLRYGIMLNVDCTILDELVNQIQFTPDAEDIVCAGIKIATFIEAIKHNPDVRPIVMVQEITTQG